MKEELIINQQAKETRARTRVQWVFVFVKVVISISLIFFIVARANLSEVWEAVKETHFFLIVCAALLNPIGGMLIALRWKGLLRYQGVNGPLYRLVQSCIIANFFRQFLPSTVGGDAIRGYDSYRMGASKTVAVSTLVIDRSFGVMIMLLFAIVAILFSPKSLPEVPLLPLWIGLTAGSLFFLLMLIFLPSSEFLRPVFRVVKHLPQPIQKVILKLVESLTAFQGQTGLMFRSLGLSVLLQSNVIFFYVLIGAALGLPVPLMGYFIIVPIATLVMMIPISINAIGLREGIFVLLLDSFGVTMAEAIAFAWLEYGLFLLYGIAGGVLYALRR